LEYSNVLIPAHHRANCPIPDAVAIAFEYIRQRAIAHDWIPTYAGA
jgi:hypothetical protein